jgi:hypothetical protein
MMYINMGHNDIDYEHYTTKNLSSAFANNIQNEMIINGLVPVVINNSNTKLHP